MSNPVEFKPNKVYNQILKAVRGQDLREIFMAFTMVTTQILVRLSKDEQEALARAEAFHDDIHNSIRANWGKHG